MKQTVKKGKSATSKRPSVGALTPLTKAQKELVAGHIPFAMNMVKKYAGLGRFKGIPVEDLQQEACFGLCIAAQKWSPSPQPSPKWEGVDTTATFQTYAYKWCLKYIMMAINGETLSTFGDEEVVDIIDDDDEQEFAEERAKKVEAMMAVLNDKELKVVRLLYGFEGDSKDFQEIAVMMHIQVARVHQIYEKARTKMEFSPS